MVLSTQKIFHDAERKMLPEFERGEILVYNDIIWCLQRIVDAIKHSKTVIFNFLYNPITYGFSKSPGRIRMLLKWFEHLIFRMVTSKRITANEIGRQIMMTASVWTAMITSGTQLVLLWGMACFVTSIISKPCKLYATVLHRNY